MGRDESCVFSSPKCHAFVCLFQWSTTVHLEMIAVSTSVWACFRAFIANVVKDTHSMRMKQRAQVSEGTHNTHTIHIWTFYTPTTQAYNYMLDIDIILTNNKESLMQRESLLCHHSFRMAALCCYKAHATYLSTSYCYQLVKPLHKNKVTASSSTQIL